ncbi:MAG: hypothetical protein ACE5ED_04900 [Rhodothalassiaceae bacterium]
MRLAYDAFDYRRFGMQRGIVKAVSATILSPDEVPRPLRPTEPVYRVTVALDRQSVRAYGTEVPLQAGMTLAADIVLERSLRVAGQPLSLRDIKIRILFPVWHNPLVLYGLWQGSLEGRPVPERHRALAASRTLCHATLPERAGAGANDRPQPLQLACRRSHRRHIPPGTVEPVGRRYWCGFGFFRAHRPAGYDTPRRDAAADVRAHTGHGREQ